jgi:hypothetical protein
MLLLYGVFQIQFLGTVYKIIMLLQCSRRIMQQKNHKEKKDSKE